MDQAVHLVTEAPQVVSAMAQGRLDGYRAGIVTEELRDAPAEVNEEVLARIERYLGTEPGGALRKRIRRTLGAVAPEFLRTKAARARAERSLRRSPSPEPGVDEWTGRFPVEESRTGWAVVDSLARRYVKEGRSPNLENARADALMDLIHAQAPGEIVVQVTIPASQLAHDTRDEVPDDGTAQVTPEAQAEGQREASAPDLDVADPAIRSEVEPRHVDELVPVEGFGTFGVTHVRRRLLESLTTATREPVTAPRQPGRPHGRRHLRRPHRSTALPAHCWQDPGTTLRGARGRPTGRRAKSALAMRPGRSPTGRRVGWWSW